MKLSVFGAGYVGLVTGACLADVGHFVQCMDVNEEKVGRLKRGDVPIYEPGLEEIIARNTKLGTLEFTTDAAAAVRHSDLQVIAVGTPPDESGAADLQHVLSVARGIGQYMDNDKVVIVKSTVPVGTCDRVGEMIATALLERRLAHGFDVVSNPEFLKEGAAVSDFLKPDRIVVGAVSDHAKSVVRELYEPFNRNHDRTLFMDVRSAELTKYAANAMLATKISFINEMANLSERLGADIEHVRRGIGADPRIGHHFIYPGVGYGGSCFPKDVQALAATARSVGYHAPLIEAVEVVNQRQKRLLFSKIAAHFGGERNLAGKIFAVWGLSFKPNTDDMREAPSRTLMEALWAAGAKVQAFDPAAMPEAERLYGSTADLTLAPDKYGALSGADALVICTEWQQFRAPDLDLIESLLRGKIIFDGRNVLPHDRMLHEGWTYVSIGRGDSYLPGSLASVSRS